MKVQRIETGPLTLYVEGEIREEMRGGHMGDAVFAAAVDHMIIACVDVAIVNRARRTLLLCRRRVRPMRGLWVIGGRRRKGETPITAMCRSFQRETGLELPEERFVFVMITEYLWQDRQQKPVDHGSHNLAHQFVIELTDTELASAAEHLDPVEFDRFHGIQEFTRGRLVEERVHPAILQIYDTVFPESER
ncbi:MAG: NUDIX domain-containing protein [Patescibacteria group bacterium]